MNIEGVGDMENNNNGILIGLVVFLVILVLGLIGYIAYDKGLIFNDDNKIEENNKNNEENDLTNNEDNNPVEIKELDLTKSLNTSGITYELATNENDFGLSMSVNPDKKSVTLSIDWTKFCYVNNPTGAVCHAMVIDYPITGFTKDVANVFIGTLGQDASGITLFYLMSDGTIEYTPLYKRVPDSQGYMDYRLNGQYEYTDNGLAITHFTTSGSLTGVNNAVQLYNTKAYAQVGWATTIGATADGSFYDLGHIINN